MKKMLLSLIAVVAMLCVVGGANAATTNDVTGGGTSYASGLITPVVMEKTVNFLKYPCAAGDVCKVITIPSNFLVQAVIAKCATTNTGTASAVLVGDRSATNTWMTTAISMVSVTTPTQCTNAFSNGGKLYTSPDFVSVVPTIAITNGTFNVKVLGTQL